MHKIRTMMFAAVSVVCTTMVAQKSITERIYWIDGDIGSAQTVTSNIDIASLSAGLHFFTIRVQDSENLWSSPLTKFFVIPESATAASIAAREYWIDGKVATRAELAASPAEISLLELSAGLHSMTVRVKDDAGIWSSSLTKYFVIPESVIAATSIAEREYLIDGKVATRAELGASPAEISLVGISPGLHSLTTRVKDDVGLWSTPVTKFFVVPSEDMQEAVTLARYLYWFDDDMDHRVVGTTTETSGVFDIAIDGLTSGEHQLTLCFIDSKGASSQLVVQTFKFIVKGDANADGKVDVADGVSIVNYILGNPVDGFNIEAANVDGDQDEGGNPIITISDAVGVVNIILNK